MTMIYICPHCESPYALGENGTIEGCDVCLKIIRNPIDHTIIEEDTLTSPENS